MQPFQARASGSGFVFSLERPDPHQRPRRPAQRRLANHGSSALRQRRPRAGARLFAQIGADLALVKVDNYAKLPPPVDFGDSRNSTPASGRSPSASRSNSSRPVTVGVVSGFNRDEPIQDESGGSRPFRGMLQTSAPINPGNSGGPLVDDRRPAHRREPVDGQPAGRRPGHRLRDPRRTPSASRLVPEIAARRSTPAPPAPHRLPRRGPRDASPPDIRAQLTTTAQRRSRARRS